MKARMVVLSIVILSTMLLCSCGGSGDGSPPTLTINKNQQNFTLVDNNGNMIFKAGDGGSTITLTNAEHIRVTGDDGTTLIFQQG